MIVSILIPTRKRFDIFEKSINSLFENCNSVENFEVLVAIDNDDIDSISKIENYILDKPNIKFFLYERQFYHGLHNYYNNLAINAVGDFLLLWNDDAIMKSKHWDIEILKYKGIFCVLSPKVDTMEDYWINIGVLFPIIPKKWIDITGEWSHVPACDSWIDVLSKRLHLLVNVENIVISHDRNDITGNNNDQTYLDGLSDKSNPIYNSLFNFGYPEILEEHYTKLYDFLENKNTIKFIWPN
jgi:hypothetical protein